MPHGYSENITPTNNSNGQTEAPTIIKTDEGVKDGQNKCPKCGSTDISLNIHNSKLRCNFCRYEFEPEKSAGLEQDLTQLQGQVVASGATDIIADTSDIVTFKCSSCGAQVVIDTASAFQARCHWCRNTLSVNQQIPNGSIPDVVLPFGISKTEAQAEIAKFVGKRKFYAHPKFRQEFTTENIMGVYLPYMLIDANAHVNLVGQGEQLIKSYYTDNGKRYNADLYHVEREFDLVIQGLTIESSADKLNNNSSTSTNNVINSIMPFDLENCVKFNANYLKGYTSEKRDINIDQLRPLVTKQSQDIAKFAANSTLQDYDRGVAWDNEQLDVKGQQWTSAYLPVWLYSYLQVKGSKKVLHYVAVNARTKETMGSVPIHIPKLLGISFIIEILSILAIFVLLYFDVDFDYDWLFLFTGFIYFFATLARYRNSNARHNYETETQTNITNLRQNDQFIKTEKGLTSPTIVGVNNILTEKSTLSNQVLNSLIDDNPVASLVKEITDKEGDK